MAETEVLNVTTRETRGTANARRDRLAGRIPAVLYGHGKDNVPLSVSADELTAAIRQGSQFVELAGDVKDSALIREVQWDALGVDVLHIDLTRAEKGETVEVTLSIELRGVAPGTRQGGVVQQPIHEVQLECPVIAIPEKLTMNVNTLELFETKTASDLEVPEGSKLLMEPDTVIVQCVEAAIDPDEDEAGVPTGPAEPEVIGAKPDEEGGDS